MSKNITKAQAVAAYRRVCKQFDETPHDAVVEQGSGSWPDVPVLVRDFSGYSGGLSRWAVCWESGPFEWALADRAKVADSAAVFAEPITSYALGLYPA
jgi:hypothetical protein